ncbi:MAG TPA: helix-turn-helix domain-containing protein [Acidimicrobiales bacterium]|nr:helix-turn-helix domain-containing protein [Acidimicrobiales bacterium]
MKRTVSGVGVLDKSVALLDALSDGPLSLAELSERAALPRATAHRLASALEVHGFVTRDTAGQFMLGARLPATDLAAVAAPIVAGLRDDTGESAQLYVVRGERRVCVLALDSPHSLRTIVAVGAELPLGVGSAGRVLQGETSSRGWVASVEERERGVASVSAPVVVEGRMVAAVSVSGPVDRLSRAPGRRFGPQVAAAAESIGAALSDRR